MTSYNSQVSKGDYRLQFETDNYEYFKLIEMTIRLMIDDERLSKQSITSVNINTSTPNIKWPTNLQQTIKI